MTKKIKKQERARVDQPVNRTTEGLQENKERLIALPPMEGWPLAPANIHPVTRGLGGRGDISSPTSEAATEELQENKKRLGTGES